MADLLKELEQEKLIAIVRGIPEAAADQTLEALANGGVKFIEVTMNTAGAEEMITRWRRNFGDELHIGAGTVLDVEMAKQAIAAGAQYLITPNLDEEVVQYALDQQVEIWPGTMTPSEIVRAWKAGARAVKVFPTSVLGEKYIKDLQGPLHHIKMISTGGVNLDNIQAFVKAGAFAVGLGGNLVNKQLIDAGNFEEITSLAKQYTDKLKNI